MGIKEAGTKEEEHQGRRRTTTSGREGLDWSALHHGEDNGVEWPVLGAGRR